MKELFAESAVSAIIRVVGTLLSLLVVVIMARALSPAGYGLYTYVLSVVTILSIPAKMGLPTLVTRETAVALVDGDVTRVWGLWLWAHRLVIVLGVLVLGCLLGWLTLATKGSLQNWQIWFWGALLVPILALGNLRSAALRGVGHVLISQVPETILRPAFIIVSVLAFYALLSSDLNPEQAMMLNVIGSVFVFAIGVMLLLTRAPRRPSKISLPNDRSSKRAWLISALTLGLTMGVQNVGGNMDVIMLNLLMGNYEVGLYKVALTGGSMVSFGLLSINMILMPRVAGMYRQENIGSMQTLVTSSARLAFIFTILACFILVFFGQWLLIALFGHEYSDSYLTLLIIAGGYMIGAFLGPIMLVANMTGNESSALKGAIGFAIANIILNFTLIPFAGKEGAAVATALSLLTFNFYLWHVVRKKTGINTAAHRFVKCC